MATITEPGRKPTIQHTGCFVDGAWQPSRTGSTFETIDPATEGAKCLTGGGRHGDKGYFVRPYLETKTVTLALG